MAQNIKLIRMEAEFTRPANTTAYGANKEVTDGNTRTLRVTNAQGNRVGGLVAGGSYQIKSVELVKSSSGTTNASFDVYFYSSGVTSGSDGAAFTPTYANKNVRIGKTTLAMYTGDTNSTSAEAVNTDVNLNFWATDSNLYARIVATAAYSPTSAETFYLKVFLIRLDE